MHSRPAASSELPAHTSASPVDRRAVALFLGFGLLVGGWYSYVVTHGTFRFVGREPEWRIFPAMWQSLVHGRFDIDPAAIPGEGFHRDGKTYTYFGIFPALVRGAASLFADLGKGGLSQASSVLAALITFLAPLSVAVRFRLDRGHRAPWFALYVLTIALATPILFGLALADVYDEAILWGAAWQSVFTAALLCFALARASSREADRALLVMSLAAGLALLTRVTSGLCAGLELAGVLLWMASDTIADGPALTACRTILSRRAVRGAIAIGALSCAAQGFINYERWGNPLEFRPLQLHELFAGTERGRLYLAHGQFGLDRVPTSACFYLLPDPASVLGHWPFLASEGRRCFHSDAEYGQILAKGWQITGEKVQPTMSPYYDLIEGPRMPLTIATPALVLFALVGAWRTRFRRPSPGRDRAAILLALSILLMGSLLLTLDALALRYEMDFVPALAGLGLVALLSAEGGSSLTARKRLSALITVGLLVGWSIMATQITTLIVKDAKNGVPRAFHEAIVNFLRSG